MFDREYRAMMENVAPSQELVQKTADAMRRAGEARPARHARGTLALAMLLLLFLIGASAIAFDQSRYLNWHGEDITEEIADPVNVKTRTQSNVVSNLLKIAPDNEYWSIRINNGHFNTHMPGEDFVSLEAMAARIKASDAAFLVPAHLPDGYAFVKGRLNFYLSRNSMEAGVIYLGEEIPIEGVQLRKFRIPDIAKADILAYEMHFVNPSGESLLICCDRSSMMARSLFYVEEGGSGESVQVPRMVDGIYSNMTIPLKNRLTLRQEPGPVVYGYWWPFDPEQCKIAYASLMEYDTFLYNIYASSLGKDGLIKIAEILQ